MCFVFAYRVTGESVGNKKSQLKKVKVNTVRKKDTPKHTQPCSILFLYVMLVFIFLFVFVFHKAPKRKLI